MADNTEGAERPRRRAETPAHFMTPFLDMRRQMDSLLQDMLSGWAGPQAFAGGAEAGPGAGVAAAVGVRFDVQETPDALEVTGELPGLTPDEVSIDYTDGVLTITGEKTAESSREAGVAHVSERRFGAFRRSFRVPEAVVPEEIEARFQDGVLTVVLPKKPEARERSRKIPIGRG